ncbi:D-arabinose 1-dehydrogenase [Harpegnathos saltator]|uniref:D-arabinose 1-dehydrogenase n=1 Tax=Harpegnathos saltator TaxID=610380 RepID=E2BZW4_HARSA|nr:D-arabinose 1-dehydrogenase [Harpegnathos saltator]
MKYKKLGKTDLMVSKLAFGGGPLGFHYSTYDETNAIEAVRQAIKQGVNYIDTAPFYGQGRSEETLGKALKGIPRQAYYIATKVGRYEMDYENMFDFTVEKTRKSIEKSLKLLGVDYIDVIQVHDIEFGPSLDIILTQTLPELSKQVANGKAKYIGVTGYPVTVLKECVERSNINISCILSYTRLTLIDDTLLEYVPFFKEHDIGLINAALLCMAILTNYNPPSWHPASEETKRQCANAAQYCKAYADTNLVGIQSTKQLEMNLDVLLNGITEKEKIVLQEIREKFLSKIKNQHWEGKEVAMYREHMKNKL